MGSNRISQTFSFVNESGDDFHLTSSDTGARNWGTDLSSDTYLPFSVDIDGQTRPTGANTWDIGADEYVVVDTTPPTPNPMTFATAPYNDSATQISMVATTASDPSTPVQYLFTFTACGSNGGTGGSPAPGRAARRIRTAVCRPTSATATQCRPGTRC